MIVRCGKHDTIVDMQVVGEGFADGENGPNVNDLDWEGRCPVGGEDCHLTWEEVVS